MYKESELTGKIIGAAIAVHNEIGPGFQERIYHQALIVALDSLGLHTESEKEFNIVFRDTWVWTFRLDIAVEGRVVVELKSIVGEMSKLFQTQTISYLKASGLEVGLLINFGNQSLEVKRLARYSNYQNTRCS